MFETLRIKLLGSQPRAVVTDNMLKRIIQRDFKNDVNEVIQKLNQCTSDTPRGKNRLSAAILKLSNKDYNTIDHFIDMSRNDFRDVISLAEYPRCSKIEFYEMEEQNLKQVYLDDWIEYSTWLNQ